MKNRSKASASLGAVVEKFIARGRKVTMSATNEETKPEPQASALARIVARANLRRKQMR